MTSQKVSPSVKKYLDIIASGEISESQIIAMKSLMGKNKDVRQTLFDALSDKELTLSPSHNQKGIDFLKDQFMSPTGKERKNNPFRADEQAVLANFSHFTLKSFWNVGNSYVDFFVPVYVCYSTDGGYFQYYYNGEVNIIG